MLEKNNLIIIYGKAATFKSSLGVSLLNSSNKKCCYIDLEGNSNHIHIDKDVVVYDDYKKINNDFIINCINRYDVILVDYIHLMKYEIEDILNLKQLVVGTNKTLILIAVCSCKKNLINEYYNKLRDIADFMILTDRPESSYKLTKL